MLPHGRCSVTQRGQAGRWAEQYAWSDVRGDVGRLVSTFGALPVVLANRRFHRHGPHASYVEPTIDDDRQSCRPEPPTVLARRVAIETASGGELSMIPATIGNLRITSSFEDEQSSFEDAGKLITFHCCQRATQTCRNRERVEGVVSECGPSTRSRSRRA